MAPKLKSTSSRNPLHSKASTSSDPTPSHVQFRGTDLPTFIHSREWESLCDVLVTYPFMLIQEFYSNVHGFNLLVPLFITRIRGTHIVVTPKIIFDVLRVPRVEHPNYPGCDHLKIMSKDKLIYAFCKRPSVCGKR